MSYVRSWPNTGPQIEHYHKHTYVFTWKFALVAGLFGLLILAGVYGLLKVAAHDFCPLYYGINCLN